MVKSLYEEDILLWVEQTVKQLKARDFASLDLEHLIEEVEALGVSQKRELLSRLIVLMEHLLKRLYVDLAYDHNGWERTSRTQRTELDILLSQIPSLKSLWVDILAAVKRTAIPKPHDLGFCFCPEGFFAPAAPVLLCSGLMVANRTDTASPAAKIFLLALISRSW
jgi:hypothetical protein